MPKHALHRCLLLLALLASPPLLAQQAASDQDIERLLQASRAQSLLANLLPQVDANQRQQFDRITAGKTLTPEQQTQLDSIQSRTTDTLHQALSWEQVKPLYTDVYRQNFSREDILAITKFYESDAGQHLLDKNPVIMQGLTQAIQQKAGPSLAALETELQQVVDAPPPAPPVSPPEPLRNEVIPESCHKVKVRHRGKTSYKTVCRTSLGHTVTKGGAKATSAKKKATSKKKAATKATTTKKPVAKKKKK